MKNSKPFSAAEVEILRDIVARLESLDDGIGGWLVTHVDCRTGGFSLHVKYDKKVSAETSLAVVQVFEQATFKLCQIAARVLDQLDANDADGSAP